jgi:hypothetical protein
VRGQEGTISLGNGQAPEAEQGRAGAVADKVAAIIAAAEHAAEAITREAQDVLVARRAEADRYAARVRAEADAEAARARDLARTLVAHATQVLRGLDERGGVPPSLEGLAGDITQAPPRVNGEGPGSRRHSILAPGEEARAMALQMAMAGRTRGEVETDLRHGLRLDDPRAVLDDVFGQGTAQHQRIPWAEQVKGRAP